MASAAAQAPVARREPLESLWDLEQSLLRRELGQKPHPEGWYHRFPQWKERLARLFQVDQALAGRGSRA